MSDSIIQTTCDATVPMLARRARRYDAEDMRRRAALNSALDGRWTAGEGER